MKKRWNLCLRASPLLIILCTACTCMSAQSIEHNVTATGAVYTQNTTFGITGTLGQPIIGQVTDRGTTTEQGFWYSRPLTQASSAEPATTGVQFIELNCSPNPISTTAQIHMRITGNSSVTLVLTDLAGKTVLELLHEESLSGVQTVELSTEGISSGRYTLTLRTGTGTTSLPIFIAN